MKIVIAEGRHDADYIISMFDNNKNNVIVINSNKEICDYLSSKNDISVIHGKPTKESVLELADVEEADVFIALSEIDVENYVACQTAKQVFNVKRCVATVINPKNVDVFKAMGINSVLSSTYLLAEQVQNEAKIDNMIKTLSLENNKIQIIEMQVSEDAAVCGKTLGEIRLSKLGSVSAVYRNNDVIIPNGATRLKAKDMVLVVTTNERKEDILEIFQRQK